MAVYTLEEYAENKKKKKQKLGSKDIITLEENKKRKQKANSHPEDIAPVLEDTTEEDSKWYQGWLKKGDGTFGQNLKATGVDLAEDLSIGVVGSGEKILDALMTIGPTANAINKVNSGEMLSDEDWKEHDKQKKESEEFVKKDLYDEEEVVKNKITNPFEKKTGIDVESMSVLGSKTDSLVQSAGQMGVTLGTSLINPLLGTSVLGATSFGAEMENALNNGATYDEAMISSTISAGAEILTEKISGAIKLGGKTLDELIPVEKLAQGISNKLVRNLINVGVDATGEGFEEIVSGYASAIGQKLTYMDEKEIEELFSNEDKLESFLGGAILGGVAGGVKTAVDTAKGKDSLTGMNDKEKTVFDKLYDDAVKEKGSEKLSQKDKNKIYDETLKKLEKGYVDTDIIESTLGGKTYDEYKKLSEEAEEFNKLYTTESGKLTEEQKDRLAQLKEKNTNNPYKTALDEVKGRLSQEVRESVKGNKLLEESYNEKARKGQKYEADLTKYDANQQEVIKKAVESGVLNNTNKTHDFVDFIARMTAGKDVTFDFANNQKLMDSGFAIQGKTINGYVQGNNIVLNVDSAKALNTVVGHEITHVLEGTELYSELQTLVEEYAKTKGEYDSRMEDIVHKYRSQFEGEANEERLAKYKAELTADFVGDYLFTDADFVNNLSATKPNVFKKVFDEIKYLCKLATTGSTEEKKLLEIKRTFEKAWNGSAETNNGTRFAISKGMTSEERYNELKDKTITVGKFKTNEVLDNYDLKGKGLNDIYKFIVNNRDAIGLNKVYKKEEIDIEFGYSNKGIKKGVKQTADSKVDERDYMDVLANLDSIIENSVLIERHGDKRTGTEDRLKQVHVFIGAYQKGDVVTPVQLEIKEYTDNDNQLYLAVAIKKSEVNVTPTAEAEAVTISDFYTYSIADLVKKINPSAIDFLKYIPTEFLNEAQIKGKIEGLRKDVKRYNFSPFKDELAELEEKYGYLFNGEETTNNRVSFSLDDNVQRAKDYFGTTYKISEAGYLLTDGRLLDFSGKNQGASGGYRSVDHRDITDAFDGDYGDGSYSGGMVQFMQEGNIRLIPESGGINLAVKPNKEQLSTLDRYITNFRGEVILDIDDANGNTVVSIEYPKRTYSKKIINDINEYFDNGIIPEQTSELGQFRYSVSEEQNTNEEGNYNVYGKDIAFDETAESDIAPVTEETTGEENKVAGEDLSKKNADAIRTIKAEIQGHRVTRDITKKEFDEKIAKKESEYEALSRKDTKKAVDLRNQITNLETRRDSLIKSLDDKIERANNRIESIERESRFEKRRTKQQQYRELFSNLIGDTSTWKDKKYGLQYQTNTFRRNLRDIVRDANGKQDIERADAIYDELQGSVNKNEAKKNREANAIKDTFREMKINNAESTYIQMLGELRHNPDTTLTQEIVDEYYNANKGKIDTQKVDKAIDEARKLYDDLYDRVNKALSEHGFKEMGYRKGYFPHFTDPKQNWLAKLLNWKVNKDDIPTDIAGLTEFFEPQRTWQSFDKHRMTDTTDYNFLKGLDNYVNGSLDWIYHIGDIQKHRAFETEIRYRHSSEAVQKKIDEYRNNPMLSEEEVESLIKSALKEAKNPLNNFVTDMHTRTNILAGKKSSKDRNMESDFNRHAYSVMTNITSRISANQVAGSVSSALTNFIPITQSWGQVSPISSLGAMRETIQNAVADDGTIEKSDFLTNRLATNEALFKTGWDKTSEVVGGLMEVVDNFTSQTVWRSKYNENIKNGMNEDQAIKDADQFAENVMGGRSKGNMPTIFHAKNPVSKIFTSFQLEVANQYGYMFKDMPQDIKENVLLNLAKGYSTMFVGAYVYNALYSSLTGRYSAFDPIRILQEFIGDLNDDDEEKKVAKAIEDLAGNVADEIPYIGGLLGGGRIPISSAIPYDASIKDAYDDIVAKDWKSVAEEMKKPLYYGVMPMGGGQLRKTIQGASMFKDDLPVSGSYTKSGNLRFPVEETFLNVLQGHIFGQYASQNSMEYFDRELAPLKEKQIAEYKELELPISEYWDYRQGLAKQDSVEDKIEYVSGLDVTDEQKNIMINNALNRKEEIDISNYDEFATYDEFDFYSKNTDKYNFLQEHGISYYKYKSNDKLKNFYDSTYEWYNEKPDEVRLSKVITDDVIEYRQYIKDVGNFHDDEEGSTKEKRLAYISSLNLDRGQEMILERMFYSSKTIKQDYDAKIEKYLRNQNIKEDDIALIMQGLKE